MAWAALVLQAGILLVWAIYATRGLGRDSGERVWTMVYCAVPAIMLSVAGLLLTFGQKHQSGLAQGIGCVLALLPLAALIVVVGARKFDALDRAHSRTQAGRFDDPALTELARAIDRKDSAALRQSIAAQPPDWTARDRFGRTLLGHAVKRVIDDYSGTSGVAAVRVLVQGGARVGTNDLDSTTSFMCEVLSANCPGAAALLDVVLEAGGDPNATDRFDEPLIHLAECTRSQLEVLTRRGANLRALSRRDDRQGWSALMTAAHLQQWDKALYLLDQGVPANHRAADGTTLSSILERVDTAARATGSELDAGYHQLRNRLRHNTR